MVGGGEHSAQARDLDAGFLPALADGAPADGLVLLQPARGDGPQPVVGALKQQHPPGRSRTSALADGSRGRFRSVRVLPVVGPPRLLAHVPVACPLARRRPTVMRTSTPAARERRAAGGPWVAMPAGCAPPVPLCRQSWRPGDLPGW